MSLEEMKDYPIIERPWEKYYKQDTIPNQEKKTVYQEVFDNNRNYMENLALEFFMSKISFREFFINVEKTAKSFLEYGIKKGDFVTICAAGIPETVYSFYALSKIGAVANLIAPHFDKNDFIRRIGDCESNILIVMDTFYSEMKDAINKSRIKHVIILPTLNSSLLRFIAKKNKIDNNSNEMQWNQFIKDGRYQGNVMVNTYEPNIPLAMVYSSGTTGASKGILLSNDSFQNSLYAYLRSGVNIARGKKFYQIIPPWYSTGLSTSIHLPLSCGTAVFMDPRFERKIFVHNIIKHKPNYTVAPTSMYEGFLDNSEIKGKDLSFFTDPFEGGEPLSRELAESIANIFKQHGSDAYLRVGYGQCECGATVTTQTSMTPHSNGSVGIPLPGVIVGAFDDDYNKLPYNTRGAILVNTPCSMIEYFHNEAATNEYFHIDENNVKWNCTGDIGYISQDGELFIQGRASDYTMVNNQKIYNFDVEKIIMEIPGVKVCDVIASEHTGEQALTVHLILEKQLEEKIKSGNLEQTFFNMIQDKIYERTENVLMVPYIFKIRDNFPYAPSGKRDICQLRHETEGFVYMDKYKVLSKTLR